MLPVLIDIRFDTPASWWVLYAIGLVLIAYGTWAGWRSAAGHFDPRTGLVSASSRRDQAIRALIYAAIFAAVVRMGFLYALPAQAPLGKRGMGFPLHTYGLLLMTGFLCAAAVNARLAEREWGGEEGKRKREQMGDMAVWVLLGGIGGSRLLYMIVNGRETLQALPTLVNNFPEGLMDWLFGGLVFYGGLLGAMFTSWWFARKNGIPFLRLADVAIPTVSLGQCIGRLGCFSAGCCWGRPASADLPWSVQFPGASLARDLFGRLSHTASLAFQTQSDDTSWVVVSTGQVFHQPYPGAVRVSQWMAEHGHTLPLHPTQIYESIGQLGLFVLLVVLRKYRRFHGEILAWWLMLYALLRYTVELFRGDFVRGTLNGIFDAIPREAWYNISTSQFISLLMFAAGATLMVRGRRGLQPLPPLPVAVPAAA